jgi:hypothetical protein
MFLDENMMRSFEFPDLDPAVGNVHITYFHSGDDGGYYDLMAGTFNLGRSQNSTTCPEYVRSPANASIPFDVFNNEYVESGKLTVSMTFNDPASANTCKRDTQVYVNLKYQLVDCSYPSSMPSSTPSDAPTPLSRLAALRNVLGSSYPDRPFDFLPATNQYKALELLANSKAVLVPAPDDSNSAYLVLQRYVLLLVYLDTNGDIWDSDGRWLEDPITCNWSRVVCPDGSSVGSLNRTYSTVKTEPIICLMSSSLTAVLFSKSAYKQCFRKPSHGNWISDDTSKLVFG